MKGGAVALDGRIEPGDMILQVNDVNFENMTNDEAVRVLREVVQKPGPIKLVVAKCWDPNPKGYFTIPRTEPVRPIDPGAWVAHTAAVRGDHPAACGVAAVMARPPSSGSATSLASTVTARDDHLVGGGSGGSPSPLGAPPPLTVQSDMAAVVRAMARPDSGLEIRDRMWLKITIPNAFIGADVVDWLLAHVEGFLDRRDARKYASHLLRAGLIRHTVNKITFSEQCYYIFGDLCAAAMSQLSLGGGGDSDSIGPLPGVGVQPPPHGYMPYSGTYNPLEYQPMPFYTASEHTVYGYNRGDESVLSGSSGGSLPDGKGGRDNSSESDAASSVLVTGVQPHGGGHVGGGGVPGHGGGGTGTGNGNGSSSGGRRSRSSGSEHSRSEGSQQCPGGPGGGQQVPERQGQQGSQQQDIAGSRHSFKIAMGNPCELFVDVM